MRYPAVALLFLLNYFVPRAQVFSPTNYPIGYFRNPLAIPIDLSGNFGELRANHYHMGLDLKTQARQNLPVYASADGYIARIKIEPGGFGRAIYINHPNGFTTLYAHLNDFAPALDKWIKEQQYNQQSWKLMLDLPPNLFPVKKGAFIANSGNTGGSQAPHLHFEIRRTSDEVNLNPLLFGLPLEDRSAPRILKLAIFDRNRSVYEQSPIMVPIKARAGTYQTTPAVIAVRSSVISLAISTFDSHSGSSNKNGVYESELYVDDEAVIGFRMDEISYSSTRYLNAHIDYRTRSAGGPWLQHLSELPGYLSSIYKKVDGNGVLDLGDGKEHSIRIVVRDAYRNTSVVTTKIKWTGMGSPPLAGNKDPNYRVFYPLMLDGFESQDCEFYIGENCLYDSAHIRYARSVVAGQSSATHLIGSTQIPLQDSFLIRIKPINLVNEFERSRMIMQWSGNRKDVQKVQWQNEWASARFRDFGSFRLLIDTVPPQIVPIGFANGANLSKASRILFTIKDNYDKFKNVRAELDGQWLLFTNDKGRTFIYRFDEHCPKGEHELKISAEDEAGNKAVKVVKFIR